MNGSLRIRKKSTLKSFIDKSESTYNNSSKAFFSLKNSVLEKIQRFENSNINVTDDIFKQKSIYGAPLQISTNLFGRVCNIPRIVDSTVNFLLNHYSEINEDMLKHESDKILLEKWKRKFEKGDDYQFPDNADIADVYCLLKQYIQSLPQPILGYDVKKAFVTNEDIQKAINNYPQENKSLLKRLLTLLICIRDSIKTKNGENLFINEASELLFKYSLNDDMVQSRKSNKSINITNPSNISKDKSKAELLISCVIAHIVQNAENYSVHLEDQMCPELLDGEVLYLRFFRVIFLNIINVTLWITNFRIFYTDQSNNVSSFIPLMSIMDIKKNNDTCILTTKYFTNISLKFENVSTTDRFHHYLVPMIHTKKYLDIFAFHYKGQGSNDNIIEGWDIYDLEKEFERQKGINNKENTNKQQIWTITRMNWNYSIASYPSTFIIHQDISDKEIKKVNTRLRMRFPILMWYNKNNNGTGVLLRSDEPDLSILEFKDSDINILKKIGSKSKSINIIDVHTKKTYALLYPQFNVHFLEFESNDVIIKKLKQFHMKQENSNQNALIEWTDLIRRVLLNSAKIAMLLNDGHCINLNHNIKCDIDYVLSSISQILIDGYYRTLIGIQVLIEKEWCYYGYEFASKIAHGSHPDDYVDRSIAFELFLECIWTLLNQFPLHFEFNELFLETIAESLYSCLYGTFLGNCEKDRSILKEKTVSLWTEINAKANNFRNAFYDSDTYDLLVIPRLDPPSIKVWTSFHFKYEPANTRAYVKTCKSIDQTHLDLSDIGFSGLIYDKIDFQKITHLDISKNFLNHFPLCILNLYNLICLNLSHNPIKNISSDIAYILGIHLTNLKELDISSTDIHRLPKEIGMIQSLRVLKCSNNNIEKIPKSLSHLKNLELLDLRENTIKSIPNIFDHMTNLKIITLCSNQIDNIGNSKFTENLLVFDAINNNISEFPSAIENSVSLQYLLMDLNNIDVIPDMIGNFHNLIMLSVSRSQVHTISEEISLLSNLRTLSLYDNKLKTLPTQISYLTNLITLDLNSNQFIEIPETILHLKNLEVLNLSFNKITSIPSQLPIKLTKLKELNLETNSIQTLDNIPGLWKLMNLEYLNIADTNVTSIPNSFGLLKNLKQLKMDNTKLLYPPDDIVKKDTKSILKYLSNQFSSVKEPSSARFIILGEDRLDLIKSLSTNHIKKVNVTDKTTIDYYQWSFQLNDDKNMKIPIDATLMDINLDEKYDSTSNIYNLFISRSQICIITWNVNNRIESVLQWLEMIKHSNKKTDIIITCIFTDDNPNFSKNDLESIQRKYKKRYPMIKKIIGLSSPKKCDRELKNSFLLSGKNEFHFSKKAFKSNYETFEKFIKSISKYNSIISWKEYVDMASHCLIDDEEDIDSVTNYLIKNGTIYYNKKNPILKEHVIIDTLFVFKFLETLREYIDTEDFGIIHHDSLKTLDQDLYPPFLCNYLINTLEDLGIIYRYPDYMKRYGNIQKSFVPVFLPDDKPSYVSERWKEHEKDYQFGRIYEMKSIPSNLIALTQLRVRGLLECVKVWKKGLFVDYQESKELILLELDSNKIMINVRMKDKCYMSRTIIEIFECVRKMMKVSCRVFVPCFNYIDPEQNTPIRFTLEECERALILSNNLFTSNNIEIDVDKIVPDLSLKNLGLKIIDWNDLKIEKKIAEGGSAEIFVADYQGKKVAVKQLRATSIDDEKENDMMMPVTNNIISNAFTDFRREVKYISKLNHSTILEFEGLVLNPLSIVIEYCSGGDLFNFIHNSRGECDWDLRLKVAYDISRGMAIMHSHNPPIIHRDLKSPNIMIVHNDEDYKETDAIVKIADYGLSGILPEVGGREVDNPVWLAPEIMTRSNYSEKSDVYSFGVILYELLMSKEFFAEVSFLSDIESLVIEGKRPDIPKDRHDLHQIPEFIELMMECWHNDENKRPSFKEIHIKLVDMMQKHAPYLKPSRIDNFDQYLVNHEQF